MTKYPLQLSFPKHIVFLFLAVFIPAIAGCGAITWPPNALPTAVPTAPPYDPAEFLPTEGIAGSRSLAYDIGLATIGQSLAAEEFSRMPVPLIGAISVPEGEGPFPLAIVLHGRHPRCYNDDAQLDEVWPCPPDTEPRYDIGFSYLLDALSARGYLAVAPSVNGAYTTEYSPDGLSLDERQPWVNERMIQIVNEHLAGLNAASAGEPVFGEYLDLTGKVDSSRIALIAHSTAGITANQIAGEDRLPVAALLLLAPMHFEGTMATADTPAALLLAACDGDRPDLPGQTYFENARIAPARESSMVSVFLAGANHNFFNQELAAQGIDDGFFSRNPDCAGDRQAAGDQQAFLTNFAGDFIDAAFDRAAPPPFLGTSQPVPTLLYENQIQLALVPPSAQRVQLITPPDAATTTPPGSATGPLEMALCRPGVTCAEGILQPGKPGQVRLSWNGDGAVYRVDFPEDSSGYETLRLRAAVDPTHPLNSAAAPVTFRVRLIDTAGNQATIDLPAPLPFPPKGTYPGDDFRYSPVLPQDIRLPMATFSGVDPSSLAAVELVFDTTPTGSIFLSDLELLRPPQ